MKIKREIKQWVEDNGHKFHYGDDIGFTFKGERYIGVIDNIINNDMYHDCGSIVFKNVEHNKTKIDKMMFPVDEISDCIHVSID